jgi:uncharacterized oligopeptide transporter (OPT) family protein
MGRVNRAPIAPPPVAVLRCLHTRGAPDHHHRTIIIIVVVVVIIVTIHNKADRRVSPSYNTPRSVAGRRGGLYAS